MTMVAEFLVPLVGAIVLVAWLAPAVWSLRPSLARKAWARTAQVRRPSPTTADLPNYSPMRMQFGRSVVVGAAEGGHSALASAQAARGFTRNGLLGVLVTVITGFLAVRILFDLPGWFQLAWGVGIVMAGYATWRIAVLWPSDDEERDLRELITAHGMKRPPLPWPMIITALVLLGIWLLPPLFF